MNSIFEEMGGTYTLGEDGTRRRKKPPLLLQIWATVMALYFICYPYLLYEKQMLHHKLHCFPGMMR